MSVPQAGSPRGRGEEPTGASSASDDGQLLVQKLSEKFNSNTFETDDISEVKELALEVLGLSGEVEFSKRNTFPLTGLKFECAGRKFTIARHFMSGSMVLEAEKTDSQGKRYFDINSKIESFDVACEALKSDQSAKEYGWKWSEKGPVARG